MKNSVRMTFGGAGVISAMSEIRQANGSAPTPWLGRANAYTNPNGRKPGTGFVLMATKHLNLLNENNLQSLRIQNGLTNVAQFAAAFTIVKSTVMDFARAGDGNAMRLVEFQDKRRLLALSSIDDQYNVRIPSPNAVSGAAIYYAGSLSSGTTIWTWQTMLDDIWGELPVIAGTAPTLPYTPSGTPENWRFVGVSAWDAYNDVLDKLNCTITFNPILGTFGIAAIGATQSGLAVQMVSLRTRLLYDYDDGQNYNLANIPETIRVWFSRRELYHGIEEDSPDADNWEMTPATSKDFSTASGSTLSGSVCNVWDDLPALYDSAGAIDNDTALQTRATEVGGKLELRLAVDGMRRVYSGIVSVVTGSQVSGMIYRDYGDGGGMVTEVIQSAPMRRQSASPPGLSGSDAPPIYPRVSQMVQIDDGVATAGDTLSPDSFGFYPGYVVKWANNAWVTLESCYIRPTDLVGTNEATILGLKQKDRFVGRLSGTEEGGAASDWRPVYVVRGGSSTTSTSSHMLTADEMVGPVTINSGDTIDFDASDQCHSDEANGTVAERGIVILLETDGVDSTIKRLKFAIDKSILQNFTLTGSATSGTDPVLVKAGTRNSVDFDASSTSPVTLTGGTGSITFGANNPFHTVTGDASGSVALDFTDTLALTSTHGGFTVSKLSTTVTADYTPVIAYPIDGDGTGPENLNISDTLEFTSSQGTFNVTKASTTVTVDFDGDVAELPVGTVIMSISAPILDTKYYMDDGTGTADTRWALMDGDANGAFSGIIMATSSGTADSWFVRGKPGTSGDASESDVGGRTVPAGSIDDDEVEIEIADHDDHAHTVTTTACDDATAPGTGTKQFEFATIGAQGSSGTLHTDGVTAAPAGVREHSITITNGQQGTPSEDKWEMTPPNKKLYFYEKIA
jgi:hypothetical protein